MFNSNVCITCANVKFGTHVTCQVATGLNDIFKVFNSTNNTHLLFQFCIFLLQFVYHCKIKGSKYYSTPTVSGNNVNLIKLKINTLWNRSNIESTNRRIRGKIDNLIHIYMTTNFPGFLQTF